MLTRNQIGIAVDRLRPGAAYTQYATYAALLATWADETAIPTQAELEAAYTEWEAEQAIAATVEQVQDGAEAQAAAVPGFASWTEQHGLDWIDTNMGDDVIDAISNLADAKLLMKKQVTAFNAIWRLTKALVNEKWPNLQEPE